MVCAANMPDCEFVRRHLDEADVLVGFCLAGELPCMQARQLFVPASRLN